MSVSIQDHHYGKYPLADRPANIVQLRMHLRGLPDRAAAE